MSEWLAELEIPGVGDVTSKIVLVLLLLLCC